MRRLTTPTLLPARVLSICISGVKNPDLEARLANIEPTLIATATQYDQHAKVETLFQIPRVTNVGTVTKEELQNLYTEQMSATNGAARSVYNALRNSAPNSKCPLCGIGTIAVLDHHLPKSRYPDLAVCPYNLVPVCEFCNNAKRARYPLSAGRQTIHPYYDDFTQEQWIYAKLDKIGPPVLSFFVQPPSHWSSIRCERAQRHFDVVKLGHSFTSNANDDLITLRAHLASIVRTKGAKGVHDYLEDEQSRYSGRINSWQFVMYQTLAKDNWFINGGYLEIPKGAI